MRVNPKQERAESTVQHISEAAIQLLNTPKSPDFTTNHIAEHAGVSVGTLYRYFPAKGAILRYLVCKEASQARKRAFEIIATSPASDAKSLLHEVLETAGQRFSGRQSAARQIRTLVEADADLAREVAQIRMDIVRRLYTRIAELEPWRPSHQSEATLATVRDAFVTAIQTFAAHNNDRPMNIETRSKLIMSLLEAFSEEPSQ